MPGKLKERGRTISITDAEAVSRLVLEAAAQLAAEKAHQHTPKPIDAQTVASVARLVRERFSSFHAHGLIALSDRRIDTVDYETVFAALSLAAMQAKADSKKRGLPVTGR
jgi:hypothetical protein